MQNVYKDSRLPYSQDTKFKFPADWDPCDGEIVIGNNGFGDGGQGEFEDTTEGIFD